MENQCKWHFGKNETGVDSGPNDSIQVTFQDNDFSAIVREAIQNSLDAVNDLDIPVKVHFSFDTLYRLTYKDLFGELEDRLIKCSDYYKNDHSAQIKINNMKNYLVKNKVKVDCLTISDYNTKGMSYTKDDPESPFNSFLHSEGKSTKSSLGAGGSYGFGKGAYFALSKINTILVSSRDRNNNIAFEGATRLTTHIDDLGTKSAAYGFYNVGGQNPVEEELFIPEDFRRDESGTDFRIIGISNSIDKETEITRSVLNNFWLAIYSKKLVVRISDREINRNNLDMIISDYYKDVNERGISDYKKWNPKPYYMAVCHTGENEDFIKFESSLKHLKEVSFYIYRHNSNLPNRISYFRKPNMVVYKKSNTKLDGFVGVFVCENDIGNELLRKMENPEHNKWQNKFVVAEEENEKKIAREVEEEIEDFINDKLLSLIDSKDSEKPSFYGISEYFSIPEDFLEEDEKTYKEGAGISGIQGVESEKISEVETGVETTKKNNDVSIKPKLRKKDQIKEGKDVALDDHGELPITVGGKNNGKGGSDLGPSPTGTTISSGNAITGGKPGKIILKVKCNVAAQEYDGNLYHHLILLSEHDVHHAELEVYVGSDTGQKDIIKLLSVDNGEIVDDNIITTKLIAGRNLYKIRFYDNIKHSITLRAYEVF